MIIVLDTNIVHSDFLMKSGRFAILLDYIQKTQSRILMPKIVWDELASTYERELRAHMDKYFSSKDKLSRILPKSQVPEFTISVEDEVSAFRQHLKDTLRVEDEEIFDYKESYLHDVLDRAMRRRRPCTEKGEEIRDAVLWHSVLDIADESPDKTVIFISRNTKQFAEADGVLHPDLVQDCADRGVTVKYLVSLDDFAKQHAIHIEFISRDWLLASIDTDAILKAGREVITEWFAKTRLDNELSSAYTRYDVEQSSTGYFNCTQGTLDVDSFYVYEMADGSYRVEAIYTGEVEVECETEKVIRKEEYDYDFISDFSSENYEYSPIRRYRSTVETEYVYIYPEVYLNLEIIVRDKSVESWKVVGV
ncbi:MAG: hypothetical protein QOJ70_1812 [Acidobacteriota bacterium]|jgi:predicted nucleic acid-binding protein|nr:hypothetical protein [Acidobacteriota bacterium]